MACVAAANAATTTSSSFLLSLPSKAPSGAAVRVPRRPLVAPVRAAVGPAPAPAVERKNKKKKKGSGPGNIAAALDVEIREAQEFLDDDEQEPVPDNFPFEIHDEEGMSVITLKRDYKDEKIEVIVSMPNMEEGPEYNDEDEESDDKSSGKGDDVEEEDDEGAEDSSVSLKVTVSKGSGSTLEFTCTAHHEEITIDDMLIVETKEAGGEEQFPYEGPEFYELPPVVQKGLFKYLEQRGITLATTNFVHDYMVTKQTREYIQWMTKLKDFVRQ